MNEIEKQIIRLYVRECLLTNPNVEWFDIIDEEKALDKVAEIKTQQLEEKKVEYVKIDLELKTAGIDTTALTKGTK